MMPAANEPVEQPKPRRLLRLTDVMDRVPLCKTTIYSRIRAGTFPAPVPLGGDMVGWVESEVDAWIGDRIADRSAA